MKRTRFMAVAVVALAFSAQTATAQIRSGFNASSLARNDDGSTSWVDFGINMNFFGNHYTGAWLNNNGNITFDAAMYTYTPFNLLSTSRPIIAPFFADVDTRNAASDIMRYGAGTVGGRTAFGVDWLNVGYFPSMADKLNVFQLILIDRSDVGVGDFDFEFNYGSMQWEAGSASGDSNYNGLCDEPGCVAARAGWANGGTHTYELDGSGTPGAFLNGGPRALNGNRYLFQVRNGEVAPPEPSSVPEPITMSLLGTGLLGLGALRRRRRG